ncbi:MAG: DUF5606 domain-containing protein [Flavobacterium sp.]
MSLQKIMTISGKPGLYELKVQTRTGLLVESLLDGKKITVGLRDNVSLLSEIAMYTYNEEIKLNEVFLRMAEKTNFEQAPSHKDNLADLQSFFRDVLPEYDEERVYPSDIKKAFQWFNLLHNKGYITKEILTADPATEEAAN